jgi:hypothetical protein
MRKHNVTAGWPCAIMLYELVMAGPYSSLTSGASVKYSLNSRARLSDGGEPT